MTGSETKKYEMLLRVREFGERNKDFFAGPGEASQAFDTANGQGDPASARRSRNHRGRPPALAGNGFKRSDGGYQTAADTSSASYVKGGARGGRAAGTSSGRPRCRRMRWITGACSIRAMRRSRPPHREQASTSTPTAFAHALRRVHRSLGGGWKVRRSSAAHRHPPVPRGRAVASFGNASCRGTTADRHAARGASTP